MKIYIAKDWRGCFVYADKPRLVENLPSFPPTWTGYRLNHFNLKNSFYEDELKSGECVESEIVWAIIDSIK